MSRFADKLKVAQKGESISPEFLQEMVRNASLAARRTTSSIGFLLFLLVLIHLTECGYIRNLNFMAASLKGPYLIKSLALPLFAYYIFRMLSQFNYYLLSRHFIDIYMEKSNATFYSSGASLFTHTPEVLFRVLIQREMSDNRFVQGIVSLFKLAFVLLPMAAIGYLFLVVAASLINYHDLAGGLMDTLRLYPIFCSTALASIVFTIWSILLTWTCMKLVLHMD